MAGAGEDAALAAAGEDGAGTGADAVASGGGGAASVAAGSTTIGALALEATTVGEAGVDLPMRHPINAITTAPMLRPRIVQFRVRTSTTEIACAPVALT